MAGLLIILAALISIVLAFTGYYEKIQSFVASADVGTLKTVHKHEVKMIILAGSIYVLSVIVALIKLALK